MNPITPLYDWSKPDTIEKANRRLHFFPDPKDRERIRVFRMHRQILKAWPQNYHFQFERIYPSNRSLPTGFRWELKGTLIEKGKKYIATIFRSTAWYPKP